MDELRAPFDKASQYIAEIEQQKTWDAGYNANAFSKRYKIISLNTVIYVTLVHKC